MPWPASSLPWFGATQSGSGASLSAPAAASGNHIAKAHCVSDAAAGLPQPTKYERRTVMGKLEEKVAVITAATSGMALATAKLFVEEGAYVFITGRRKEKLDEAVKLIGRNITGVQGDAANLADLHRLYETVKRARGQIDILFASARQRA